MAYNPTIFSEETAYHFQPTPGVLQNLVGVEGGWQSTYNNHEGEEELIYRIVLGGTAIEERVFACSPKEMVTVYHGSGKEQIVMTHYCALGNQPRLILKEINGKKFNFTFLDGIGRMKLTVIDEETIKQKYAFYENGEVKNINEFTFAREIAVIEESTPTH